MGLFVAVIVNMTLSLIAFYPTSISANKVPDGFDIQNLRIFEDTLMDFEWTPETKPKLLVTEKKGKLWVLSNVQEENAMDGAISSVLSADLGYLMCTDGERGLAGVVAHPEYETNRFLYLFYTWNWFGRCKEDEVNGPVNRLSRFVMGKDDILDMSSEQVLFVTPPMVKNYHNGGDLFFGNDGLLYVSVGDGFYDSHEGPRDPNLSWPRDPGNLLGKILRLTDDGGIPNNNPFAGTGHVRCNETGRVPEDKHIGVNCKEVFASGLRHPFKIAPDPDTKGKDVRFFINDVGFETWEEINECGTEFAGVDYGWPEREGPCRKDQFVRCNVPAGLVDPVHWYQQFDGAAILGGAFIPRGLWPMEYDGNYLYADFQHREIERITYGGKDSGCRLCDPPTSDFVNSYFTRLGLRVAILTMKFGPFGTEGDERQALYYVHRPFDRDESNRLVRIIYNGTANRSPRCKLEYTTAHVGFSVVFDGSGSTDADEDILTYHWDFNGDGTVDQSTQSAQVSFEYEKPGMYMASLTIIDGNGGSDTCAARIEIG